MTRSIIPSIHVVLFYLLVLAKSFQLPGCRSVDYERCVDMADPLIKQPQLIFPDNMQDIDYVCRKWNNFVDCIKHFTDKCFTEKQRRQFNRAVENPIESVHQMCTQPDYQKEYLHYAPCMKNTVTERSYCSPHYTLLVEQVSQGEEISKNILCCSHNRFRECVLRETRRVCDRGIPDGPAFRFSSHIIDKSLSFLQEQCFNYIFNEEDCSPGREGVNNYGGNPTPTVESRWNGYDEQLSSSKSMLTSILTPPRSTVTLPWMDASDPEHPDEPQLGPRSRPSSYGRSKNWSKNTPGENEITHPSRITANSFSETSPGVSSPSVSWGTAASWHGVDSSQEDTSKKSIDNTFPISIDIPSSKSTNDFTTPYPIQNDRSTVNEMPSNDRATEGLRNYDKPFSDVSHTPDVLDEYSSPFEQSAGTVSESVNDMSYMTDDVSSSTETWYPAAGNQLTNEVDEPNQQGWIKPDSDSKGSPKGAYLSLTFIATTLSTFC